MIIQGTPIEMCVQIIERYIYELKGIIVHIQLPIIPEHEEKFIQALNIASSYYGINL